MPANPFSIEIAEAQKRHLRRISQNLGGLKDWRKAKFGEDRESAAERVALVYAVVDFILDSPRWERMESEMRALRERNEARRRENAA